MAACLLLAWKAGNEGAYKGDLTGRDAQDNILLHRLEETGERLKTWP